MKKITRRNFFKQGAALCSAALCSGTVLNGLDRAARAAANTSRAVDIAVAEGADYYAGTFRALDVLGGMGRFVPKGSRVCLLINSPFANPGSHVSPDVALAAVKMCFEAGASKVVSLKNEKAEYWSASRRAGEHRDLIRRLTAPGRYVTRTLPGWKALKSAEIYEDVFSSDVFINVSIVKHHRGTRFSCLLKNMMGALPHTSCSFFHKGTGGKGYYDDLPHLNQCIADINLVRRPDLVIADATEFITTNGPYGPGKMAVPRQVLAGTDSVLLDTYGCSLLGLAVEKVPMIQKAAAHGLGKTGLKAAVIQKVKV